MTKGLTVKSEEGKEHLGRIVEFIGVEEAEELGHTATSMALRTGGSLGRKESLRVGIILSRESHATLHHFHVCSQIGSLCDRTVVRCKVSSVQSGNDVRRDRFSPQDSGSMGNCTLETSMNRMQETSFHTSCIPSSISEGSMFPKIEPPVRPHPEGHPFPLLVCVCELENLGARFSCTTSWRHCHQSSVL